MNEVPTLLSAFTVGLLGSAHCIGMCGGITSALSLSLEGRNRFHILGLMSCYHIGRIFSYALAGFLLASLGWFLGDISPFTRMALRYLAGAMLIAMGLYLTGWWRGLVHLEKAGQRLWQHIQPLSKSLLPVTNASSALLLGSLWGWLPCGLVYSSLAWAASQGNGLHGAALMACFGLGTVPAVFITGAFSRQLKNIVQAQLTQNIAGIMVILFGSGPCLEYTRNGLCHCFIRTMS